MVPILASTRSAFFRQYSFDLDPDASLHCEFHRLARSRKWKQGSNSKIFDKAWNHCFGSDVPVGSNIDKAQHGTDNDDFFSMLHSLQNLDLGGKTGKGAKAQTVGTEFTSFYGNDARVTERWQELCRDCGINPAPPSIGQCKKVLPFLPCARWGFIRQARANISLPFVRH